jgi:tetratricopeptide (TPR) repeat protein
MTGGSFALLAWAALSLSAPAGKQPWEHATAEQEQKATALFEQGNRELLEYRFEDAAGHYREALGYWDLPAIHYNLAVALRSLSDLIQAREHLEIAVRYGTRGLPDSRQLDRAMKDLSEVEGELSRIELTCDQPGAKVTIDERKDLFTCPRVHKEWIRPGLHVIRIRLEKPGYTHPMEKKPTLAKGEKATLRLKVYPDEEMIQTRTPLPGWLPWSVMGAGLAAGAGGGWLHVQARSAFIQYDNGILDCAGQPPLDQPYQPCAAQAAASFDRYRLLGAGYQNAAFGLYVGGAIAVAGGVALLYFNAPRPYSIDPETGAQVAFLPVLGPGRAGAVIAARF